MFLFIFGLNVDHGRAVTTGVRYAKKLTRKHLLSSSSGYREIVFVLITGPLTFAAQANSITSEFCRVTTTIVIMFFFFYI